MAYKSGPKSTFCYFTFSHAVCKGFIYQDGNGRQNIHSKARSRPQPLGPAVHQTHKKQNTTREKCKMQKHP